MSIGRSAHGGYQARNWIYKDNNSSSNDEFAAGNGTLSTLVPVNATQFISSMRGSSHSQLLLGSDMSLWVVKFQNNPEHIRVLANDFIGTGIARHMGLSVAQTSVIYVSSGLIDRSPQLAVSGHRGTRVKCSAGLQFGSKFVGGLMPGQVVDYLPEPFLLEVPNLNEFAGMLAFDQWTGNRDIRQAVYRRTPSRKRYEAVFIDQGHCFNGANWTLSDIPFFQRQPFGNVYRSVTGWTAFEPWLERIEAFPEDRLWAIARDVPAEWYGKDPFALERLLETLLARRGRVRQMIEQIRRCDRRIFPRWQSSSQGDHRV